MRLLAWVPISPFPCTNYPAWPTGVKSLPCCLWRLKAGASISSWTKVDISPTRNSLTALWVHTVTCEKTTWGQSPLPEGNKNWTLGMGWHKVTQDSRTANKNSHPKGSYVNIPLSLIHVSFAFTLSSHPLIEFSVISPQQPKTFLCYIQKFHVYIRQSVSELPLLFLWSISLFLHQYYVVLIT